MTWSKATTIFRTFLEKYPTLGNSLVYGTLCVAAETSQQALNSKLLSETAKPIDTEVIGRYAIYGTSVAGPILAAWYKFLDRKLPGTTVKVVVKKMLIDQFVFTPQLLVVFYVTMSVLERKPDLLEECRSKFLSTFSASCLFWLPAQAVNFSLVPSVYRVTYIGSCSFAWINILCWFKRQEVPSQQLDVSAQLEKGES